MINTKNFTSKLAQVTTLTGIIACSLGAGISNASVITFNSLSGGNLDPFTGTTEGNFTVTPTKGNWFVGQVFGNPTPSILAGLFLSQQLLQSMLPKIQLDYLLSIALISLVMLKEEVNFLSKVS